MPILPLSNPAADRARAHARWNPERETLELATTGAAQVLGPDHGVTKALAKASITMGRATAITRSSCWLPPLYRTAPYAEADNPTVGFGGYMASPRHF